MKQSDIIKLLRKEFGHHEVAVFTASAKNAAGILDCEIAYKGLSFWAEIKIDGDTLKPTQKRFIERHYLSSFCIHYYSKFKIYELHEFVTGEHDLIFEASCSSEYFSDILNHLKSI